MKLRVVPVFLLALVCVSFPGCAKKVDPQRAIEKIQKEVVSMPLAELQSRAAAYAVEIRSQKAAIEKIQQKMRKMPMDKIFSNKAMTRKIAEIGRRAEALFERYQIYAQAFQEKGGDVRKVQIETAQV